MVSPCSPVWQIYLPQLLASQTHRPLTPRSTPVAGISYYSLLSMEPGTHAQEPYTTLGDPSSESTNWIPAHSWASLLLWVWRDRTLSGWGFHNGSGRSWASVLFGLPHLPLPLHVLFWARAEVLFSYITSQIMSGRQRRYNILCYSSSYR